MWKIYALYDTDKNEIYGLIKTKSKRSVSISTNKKYKLVMVDDNINEKNIDRKFSEWNRIYKRLFEQKNVGEKFNSFIEYKKMNKNKVFITGVMGSGKTKHMIENSYDGISFAINHTKKTGESILIKSRNGSSAYAYAINVNDNLEDIKKYLLLLNIKPSEKLYFDEIQFVDNKIFNLIVDVFSKNTVYFYGLTKMFDGKLFPCVENIIKYCDYVENIPMICQVNDCIMPAKFNKRINSNTDSIVEDKNQYIACCEKHFNM